MNLRRAIGGFLLSFVFLLFFLYTISGIRSVFEASYQNQEGSVLTGSVSGAVQNIVPENTKEDIVQITPTETPVPTPTLEINAKSAISVESNLQNSDAVIFEKESNAQLPIASLTKLMTAVIVLDNYNLSDIIKVNEAADSQDPMKQDVKLGDTMSVESFLDIMLIESSNKSAYALSESVGEKKFVDLMNKKAKDLGLTDTSFADPTGLSSENISSANNLVRLAKYIIKNYPKIAKISRSKELYVPGFGEVANSDQLLVEVPDAVCSKTGFTEAANGCLLLVVNNQKNNDYLINIILGADDRFSEMKKLINWSNAICQ